MFNFIKIFLGEIISRSNDRNIFAIGSSHFSIMRQYYSEIKNLIDADYKVFSQTGEDGIIDYLLYSLNIKKPKFIEIGVGDYRESNTRFVYERSSCKGLIVDVIENLEQKVKGKTKKLEDLYYIPVLPKELTQFNYDIYKQKTDDFNQERLTSQLTPDLWPVSVDGSVFFSRQWEGTLHIYQLNTKNNKAYRKTNTKVHQTLLSAQKHLAAWVEFSEDWSESTLIVAKSFTDKTLLKLPMGVIQSVDVHPTKNLILISSNYKDDQFELYVLDLDKSCLQRLSYLKSNEYWPSWHPSGQKFIYTSDLKSQLQVYESQFFSSNSCTTVSGNL